MRRLVIAMMIPLAASRPSSPDQTITAPASLPTDDDPSQRQWTDWKAFTSAVLDATNTYREQYQAANLAWNSTLSDYAARYLDSSGKATKRDGETSGGADGETRGGEEEEEDGDRDGCKPEHSGGPYGENLAIGYGSARESVEAWGDEGQEYTQGQGFTEKTGHFTQLVWKDTTDVGCARRLCGSRQGWYLVCEYFPAGNVVGRFDQEVKSKVDDGDGDSKKGDDDDDDDDDDDTEAKSGKERESRYGWTALVIVSEACVLGWVTGSVMLYGR